VGSRARAPTALAYTPLAPPIIPAPFPSFLRRQEPTPTHLPLPQFIPPPLQGGGEVGGGKLARAPTALAYTPLAPPLIPAPLPSFLRRQEPTPTSPPPSPIHPSPLPGGR